MKVIVSYGYGAGWSTWNRKYPESAYHPRIIKLIENRADICDIQDAAEELWPDGYWSADGLEIEEVPDGQLFKITEYDGAESLEYVSIESGFILADSSLQERLTTKPKELLDYTGVE